MSADYTTKHFKGYHHKGGVAVYSRAVEDDQWSMTDEFFVYIDPEIVRELQSIVDRWKVNAERTPEGS